MSKTLLQSVKHHLILLIIFTSTYVSAESYDTNEYINLNNSICKNANKHLTLETSGFFEYIGAGKTKIFECGKTSNEPCRNNPELICRNIHKKHILHISDTLDIPTPNIMFEDLSVTALNSRPSGDVLDKICVCVCEY